MGRYTAEKTAQNLNNITKGYDAIWQVIKAFEGKNFTSKDIDDAMQSSRVMVKDFLKNLVANGFVEIVEKVSGEPGTGARVRYVYRLVELGERRPRFNSKGEILTGVAQGKEQLWRSCKMLKVFTSKDLAIAASTDFKIVSHGYTKNFLRALNRAGYVKIINKPNAYRGVAPLYRFLSHKNTGPLAPVMKRDQKLYDPNLKKIVWPLESEGQS